MIVRDEMTRILFVCMGNLCRSPLAEAVARQLIAEAGLSSIIEVDSAGTHASHEGELPDPRAMAVAASHGYDVSGIRTRFVTEKDFRRFDLILAMDRQNLALLRRLCPETHLSKLGLFMDYAADLALHEMPDPYYGSTAGFERVLELSEHAARHLIESIAGSHQRAG